MRLSALRRHCLLTLALLPAVVRAGDWQDRVDADLLAAAQSGAEVEFLVYLNDQVDLQPAEKLSDRRQRRRYVAESLQARAANTQADLQRELSRLGVDYRPFWIANMIWVKGDLETLRGLARRPEVFRLYPNPRIRSALPRLDPQPARAPQGIEWNLAHIGVPDFWAAGIIGEGAVVAGHDTGYDWQHPALRNSYRGWNGLEASHDYNWHDAIHQVGPGSACGADSPEPCDDHGHGTHTMGIMVGDDGGSNQIGVAPGARWIGCRNMDENGVGSPASYAECFQFFLAPTRLDGSNPDPDRAPDVITNSWTCPPGEGCTDPAILLSLVRNVRAAGIVVVASAGNAGPSCGSISSPPAIYAPSLTVGASDATDLPWSWSSRGAVTVDASGRLKPNVVAPGVGIRSSLPGASYGVLSGTSMAGPHVAAQVALLISAEPALRGRVETLEACIEATSVPLTSNQECAGIPGSQVPNNTTGRGRISLTMPLPATCSPDFIFADDFESGPPTGWN